MMPNYIKRIVAVAMGLMSVIGVAEAEETIPDEPKAVIICPDDVVANCDFDLPNRFRDLMDFEANGGSVTPYEAVEEFSFRSQEEKLSDDKCDYTLIRTFSIALTKKNGGERISCKQTLYVKDTLPPDFDTLDTVLIYANGKEEVEIPTEVKAEELCGKTYITFDTDQDTSTKSDNPLSCAYYNYTKSRTYRAEDQCGNAAIRKLTFNIIDTAVPLFANVLETDTVLPVYEKGCRFLAPMFHVEEIVLDCLCSRDSEMIVTQTPMWGEELYEAQPIVITITDVCGTPREIVKYCDVPDPKSICSVVGCDTTVCAGGGYDVDIRELFSLYGVCTRYYYGEYVTIPSFIHYDIYEDEIDDTHLVLSSKNYENDIVFDEAKKAGKYYIVAKDSSFYCSDTAVVNVMVNEYPRMSLFACTLNMNEGDTLHILENWKRRFQVCIDDNKSEIIEEGWMVNGEAREGDIYGLTDSLRIEYYVTNECGTTTSATCMKPSCGKIEPEDAYITVAVKKKQEEGGESDAVINIEADAEVVSGEYYNLGGQKVKEPVQGVNLVKRTRADGSTEWIKAIGR